MLAKLEDYFWGNYEITHKFHLHDSFLINSSHLKIIRFIQLLIHAPLPLFYMFTFKISMYKYLTVFGMNMTFLYFILINLTIFFKIQNPKIIQMLKRITIIVFEVTISIQMTITLFFWIFLYPVFDKNVLFPNWFAFLTIGLYMHSGCWLGLCVDNLFNTIYFDKKHILFLLVTALSYGSFTAFYEFYYKESIYPIIKWNHGDSYAYMLFAVILSVCPFFFGMWFSQYKEKSFQIYKIKYEIMLNSNNLRKQ